MIERKMIDLHTHVLPAIDDGPTCDQESLQLLEAAIRGNIDTMVMTPHYDHRYANEKADILIQTDRLQRLARENGLNLELLPGQEIRIYNALLEDYHAGKLLTLANSRYLLIEFPANQIPSYTERLFYELEVMGIKPVIAHPERNSEFLATPEKLFSLVKKGALAQLTTSSVLGFFGKRVEKFSHQLIEANLVHVVASDAHNLDKRPFNLSEAYEVIFQKHGLEQVNYFGDNARAITFDQTIYPKVPQRVRRKKRLSFFDLKR